MAKTDRRTFLNISSFQILAMFRRGMFYNYLSVYLRFFLGLTVTETTLFATIPMVLNIFCQTLVWGRLSDRLQLRRRLIIIGEISAAITTFFVWYAHTVPENPQVAGYVIIIGLSIVEIFWSMSNVGWTALLSDLYPENERAGLQGRLLSLGGLGRMAGIYTGALAYDGLSRFYEGWGFHEGLLFFIASGIMILSTIPMLFVPEGGIGKTEQQRDTESVIRRGQNGPGLSRMFILFLMSMVFINFGRNSVALIVAQYLTLEDGFNVSSGMLGTILNTGSVAILIIGFLVNKAASKRSDGTILIAGTWIAIFYLVGLALSRSLLAVFASSFLAGASQVVIGASSYAYASRLIPPKSRANQFSLFNATHMLSWGVAGTLMAGPIVDGLYRSGASEEFAYRMSFLAAAGMVFLGFCLLLIIRRMDRR